MKKCGVLFVILVAVGILMISSYADDNKPSEKIPLFRISAPSTLEQPLKEIISDTFKSLLEKYGPDQDKFTIRIEPQTADFSINIIDEIAKKECDIFISPLMVDDATKSSLPEIGFQYKKIGVAPIGVIASKSIPDLKDLSSATLNDILSGKIDDWSKISPKSSGKITVYTSNANKIAAWLDLTEPAKAIVKTVPEIIQNIAEDNHILAVIPLAGLSEADLKKINILTIGGISSLDKEALFTGRYRYCDTYYLVWKPEIAKHRFFEEFSRGLNNKDGLEKYWIRQVDIILDVPPDMAKFVNEIALKIFKDAGNAKPKLMFRRSRKTSLIFQADMAISFLDKKPPREAWLKQSGFHYQSIGVVPYRIIVSNQLAGLKDLSSAVLNDILRGKVDDWSKISPDLAGKITGYFSTSLFPAFLKPSSEDLKEKKPFKSMERLPVEDVISRVTKDKKSLGIINLIDETHVDLSKIKILSIDNVSPNEKSIKDNKYPYAKPLFLVWDSNMESDERLKRFFEEFKKVFTEKSTLKRFNIYPDSTKSLPTVR